MIGEAIHDDTLNAQTKKNRLEGGFFLQVRLVAGLAIPQGTLGVKEAYTGGTTVGNN